MDESIRIQIFVMSFGVRWGCYARDTEIYPEFIVTVFLIMKHCRVVVQSKGFVGGELRRGVRRLFIKDFYA